MKWQKKCPVLDVLHTRMKTNTRLEAPLSEQQIDTVDEDTEDICPFSTEFEVMHRLHFCSLSSKVLVWIRLPPWKSEGHKYAQENEDFEHPEREAGFFFNKENAKIGKSTSLKNM